MSDHEKKLTGLVHEASVLWAPCGAVRFVDGSHTGTAAVKLVRQSYLGKWQCKVLVETFTGQTTAQS